MATHKKCTDCTKTKELKDFNRSKSGTHGHDNYCRVCRKKRMDAYYAKKRDEILEKRRRTGRAIGSTHQRITTEDSVVPSTGRNHLFRSQ